VALDKMVFHEICVAAIIEHDCPINMLSFKMLGIDQSTLNQILFLLL
jgi:hypothetical protein